MFNVLRLCILKMQQVKITLIWLNKMYIRWWFFLHLMSKNININVFSLQDN